MGRVAEADVQTALRHREIGRDKGYTVGTAIDDCRGFDRVLHRLQTDPEAGKPAERVAVEPVIEDFLHPGGRNDRHIGIDQRPFALMEDGGGFTRVVVPHGHQDATVFRGARHVGVTHGIPGTVDARPLAVPETEDPVEAPLAPQFGLLGAPERRRREILVQALFEAYVVFAQRLFGAAHLHVDGAERRTAIAGDIARGVQSCLPVPRLLRQHEADEGLGTVQENGVAGQVETVVQGDLVLGHPAPPNAEVISIVAQI